MTKPKTSARRYSPTPFILLGFATIGITFGVMGVWAATAPLDSAVVAPGVVAVESNRKLIQHLEGGIVAEIMVTEGQTVEAGQMLVRLLPTQAQANQSILQQRVAVLRATEKRLEAERANLDEPDFAAIGELQDQAALETAIKSQGQLFTERKAIRDSKVSILQSRIEQFHQQIAGLTVQRQAIERQQASIDAEIERLRSGESTGVVRANQITAMERDSAALTGNYGQLVSESARAYQSIIETDLQIVQINQEYQERAASELKDTLAELNEITERLVVAEDVNSRTLIRAPQSGIVQNIRIHTMGGVVRPAETMMEIVPQNEPLVINAQVRPLDIDSLAPGQVSEIKFPAFSSRNLPTIFGTVDVLSPDLIYPEDTRQPAYYLARISVPDSNVPETIKGRIIPGMPADAIIVTGERTMVDYLVKPIRDSLDKSMREE
ncbi:HlyD family type I secretion periplasmic adaptor subunit [Devosia submarina]|uniref:HlyD family type I secretion periplasmic adaptor subunit n=1 Tax=Devosia submarina TaxID=1173082 RepID=UPI000D3D6B01|nr:HlyD family type I secretion periplasmic adaptor subunit [Devosia submarina]